MRSRRSLRRASPWLIIISGWRHLWLEIFMVHIIVSWLVTVLAPSNPAELADALGQAAASGRTIALAGNSTKRRMAGPVEPADVEISTLSLRRVIQYEPRDLTISVDAGLAWRELSSLLAKN